MDAVQLIELYEVLFYVSLVLTVLGLGLAVFFFIYFDIRTAFAMETGKARNDTVRRMMEQNAKTGNLRNIYTGNTGKTGATGRTGSKRITHPAPKAEELSWQAPASVETTVLQPRAMEETTLLQSQTEEAAEETVMLKRNTSGFRFQLTENTVVIHTDELI